MKKLTPGLPTSSTGRADRKENPVTEDPKGTCSECDFEWPLDDLDKQDVCVACLDRREIPGTPDGHTVDVVIDKWCGLKTVLNCPHDDDFTNLPIDEIPACWTARDEWSEEAPFNAGECLVKQHHELGDAADADYFSEVKDDFTIREYPVQVSWWFDGGALYLNPYTKEPS